MKKTTLLLLVLLLGFSACQKEDFLPKEDAIEISVDGILLFNSETGHLYKCDTAPHRQMTIDIGGERLYCPVCGYWDWEFYYFSTSYMQMQCMWSFLLLHWFFWSSNILTMIVRLSP